MGHTAIQPKVAKQVMRMPDPALSGMASVGNSPPNLQCQSTPDEQPVRDQVQEDLLQAKEELGGIPKGTLAVESYLASSRAGGRPIPPAQRQFFEPRFGRDFSGVRIHTGTEAASTAQSVGARAYTVGQDVVFREGQYQPDTSDGKWLLAHELTHVVQQGSGVAARRVQRASIPYRQLTWADFQGSVPSGSSLGAVTESGFDTPGWRPKKEITDTKETCRVKKKKYTKHSAKLSVDPAVFDALKGTMNPNKSWARLKYKNPAKHCDALVKRCEKEFDEGAARATKSCKAHVKPCKTAFDEGSTYYEFEVDGTKGRVTSKSDCATKLVSDCEEVHATKQSFEHKDHKVSISKAASKSDSADPKFKKACNTHLGVWAPLILKHEQGHFDISNVIAGKAKTDLKKEAAKYVATATSCGRTRANNEAVKKFNALNAATELSERGQKWIDLKDEASEDYDDDSNTDHGVNQKEQAAWEKNIADGLKAYDLNKP